MRAKQQDRTFQTLYVCFNTAHAFLTLVNSVVAIETLWCLFTDLAGGLYQTNLNIVMITLSNGSLVSYQRQFERSATRSN